MGQGEEGWAVGGGGLGFGGVWGWGGWAEINGLGGGKAVCARGGGTLVGEWRFRKGGGGVFLVDGPVKY